jgi:hypothetical protein
MLSISIVTKTAAEQYDEAKRLKTAIDNLKQIGAQLQKLEKAKQQAVSEEDYDRAKSLKEEIDRLRALSLDGGRAGAPTAPTMAAAAARGGPAGQSHVSFAPNARGGPSRIVLLLLF